jgi:hypothetical protein
VPVLAVAHLDQAAVSARLAKDLCAAFVSEGVSVGALVTVDTPALAAESQQVFYSLMESGAQQAKLLKRPDREPAAALEAALSALAAGGAQWIVAWGNALPQLLQPTFTVIVTGHRRELTASGPLVMQAQLEVTTPGPELPTLLVRNLLRG